MLATLLSNPHSADGNTPNTSQLIVDETRGKVLKMFGASSEHFDIIFVANATAGIKLVVEAFRGHQHGFEYYYHRDSHTSLAGPRESAACSTCFGSDEETEAWLYSKKSNNDISGRLKLFAYPAQSNMNGRRLPLTWCRLLRKQSSAQKYYSLLDVAALVSTSPLDLSDPESAPDFTVLSFYKIFGYPDLGALIVRKPAGDLFACRPYFGGGTTEMITCLEKPWFERKEKSLSARCEDGSLPIRSILALGCAIDTHEMLYGRMDNISRHTGWLAQVLYNGLRRLRHGNGTPVCAIYKDSLSNYGDSRSQGATVAFNIRKSDGTWISSSTVRKRATTRRISIRTGSMCNPAGMAQALNLTDDDVQKAFKSGFRCGQEYDILNGIAMGMVRVSLGGTSTLKDVEVFLRFITEEFVEGPIPRWSYTGHLKTSTGRYHEEDEEMASRSSVRGLRSDEKQVPQQTRRRLWLWTCR